jgi:hypothetical protein
MRQQCTDNLAHLTHLDRLNAFTMAVPSAVSWDVTHLIMSLN